MIRTSRSFRRPLGLALVVVVATGPAAAAAQRAPWTVDPDRQARVEAATDPAAALALLAGWPEASLEDWRARAAAARADYAAGGTVGQGVRLTFPPGPRDSRATALQACAAKLCAGVATGSLDPDALPLPTLPEDLFLRLIYGADRPPLAGYGDRINDDVLDVSTRLLLPDEFYAHLFRASEGTLDPDAPIEVDALVLLDAAGERLAWVKTDLIGAFQDLRAEVLARLHARGLTQFDDANLLFHGTHTHGGLGALNPRLFFQVATVDTFSEPLFDAVAERIADTVAAADAALEPARLGTGSATVTGISKNRRDTCAAAGDPPNSDPDPEIGIVRVERGDGTPLASVLNFAVHGTSYSGGNLLLTPDNAGYAERRVEQLEGGVALFINGAEGDVAPTGGDAVQVGETLGDAVLAALPAIVTSDEVRLASSYCQLDDPAVPPSYPFPCPATLEPAQLLYMKFVERPLFPGCYYDRESDGPSIDVDKIDDPPLLEREGVVFAAHRIDVRTATGATRTVVATMPGEPITDVGLDLKGSIRARHAPDHAWLFALSNAHLAYIVTEREYMEGGYEAGANVFGRTEAQVFIDNALHVVGEVMAAP